MSVRDRIKRQREDSLSCCQKCDEIMDEDIVCSGHKLHYCLECAEISQNLYQCISKGDLANFHYNCASYRSTFPSLENITGVLKDIQTKDDESIENRMDDLKRNTSNEIRSNTDSMKEDILNGIKGDIDKLVDKRNKEMEDRRRRDQNLVFFNLPEHSHNLGSENKNADESDVNKIC